MLDFTKVYEKNFNAWKDDKIMYVVNQGGTSASKTFSILQLLIAIGIKYKYQIDVVGLSVPHLKTGVLTDMRSICPMFGIDFDANFKESDKILKLPGGFINFLAFDKLGKAHGGRRDILYINEANHIGYPIAEQLMIRTRKKVFIDYNPTNAFWAHKELIEKEPDKCCFIKSTYKDNKFLEQSIVDAIESRRGDGNNNFWRVYGLGELGIAEGLVFNNFEQKNFDINGFEKYRNGVDWGFSCLKGDTKVSTNKGKIEIKNIKVGDKVLTRDGYKTVLNTQKNGIKKVYAVDFGYKRHIIATGDHKIFTFDGWKRVDELKKEEKICVKKSSLMAEFIKGIQKANTRIISIAEQKQKKEYTTETCGSFIMERFQMDILYTTLTIIRLIMILATLPVLPHPSILKYTIKTVLQKLRERFCLNMGIQKKTGKNEEKNHLKHHNKGAGFAKNAEKVISLQTFIKNIVLQNVEREQTQERAKESILAKFAEKYFMLLLTILEKPVQKNVHINLTLLKEKEEVYDITTENGEFFANNVLVHNCDPFAFVRVAIENKDLYICQEIYQRELLNKDSAPKVREIVGGEIVRCDSAEPKSIKEFQQYGIKAIPVKKGAGSIESGIKFMQSFDHIYIHPNCPNAYDEFCNYQWRMDKMGEQLPEPVDAFNHCLVPGTMIETDKGLKPIEEITTKDKVLTRRGFKRVLWAGVSDKNRKIYKVTTDKGNFVIGTGNHKIFVNNSFSPICSIKKGDKVLINKNGFVVGRVLTVQEQGIASEVYDLTVEDCHEFFANGILVHNCIDAIRYSLEADMTFNKAKAITKLW